MGFEQSHIEIFRYRTLEQFLTLADIELRDAINVVLEYVEPKKEISLTYNGKQYINKAIVGSLFEIEYKWILYLREQIEARKETYLFMFKLLGHIFNIKTEKQFKNCCIFDLYGAYYWVLNELTSISEWEQQNLYTKPTQKELNAGIERFNQLGYIGTLDTLSNGILLNYNEVIELPTGMVLRKLLFNKLSREYQEAYYKEK